MNLTDQAPRYRVRQWNELYENNRSRELESTRWFPAPNDLSGDSYLELVAHEDGAAHLGTWTAMLMVASRCTPRGLLVREDGRAHTAQSLSVVTRLPEPLISKVISRALEVGLLESIDRKPRKVKRLPSHSDATAPQASAGVAQTSANECRKKGKKGRETKENGTEQTESDTSASSPKNMKTAQALTATGDREALRDVMSRQVGYFGDQIAIPNDRDVSAVVRELGECSIPQFCAYLKSLPAKFQAGGSDGPKTWGWFIVTARNFRHQPGTETAERCGHGLPWNVCCLSPETRARMTDAIELPESEARV